MLAVLCLKLAHLGVPVTSTTSIGIGELQPAGRTLVRA